MQQGCDYKIRVFAVSCLGDQRRNFEQVIDVGLRSAALAALVNVPLCRRVGGSEYCNPLLSH
jgi:hypothetical protein